MKYIKIIISLTLTLFFFSCEKGTEPKPNKTEPLKWELISEFENRDIRYMIKFKDELYIAAINSALQLEDTAKSEIFKSSDGEKFIRIKTFPRIIGSMSILEDTLYVIHSDSIYAYNKTNGWLGKYKAPPRVSEPQFNGDMIFIKNNLYIMQTFFGNASETWKVFPDGTFEEVLLRYGRSFAGAKFIKLLKNGEESFYLRGHYVATNGFYSIINDRITYLSNGLTDREKEMFSPPNSMAIKNLELFAAFKGPATVKKWENDNWVTVTDSLPYSQSANNLTPVLRTHTTAIAFYESRMFVSTQAIGILEWTDDGWKRITPNGLLESTGFKPHKDLYVPIPSFEIFNGKLLVAYGSPGYAPYTNKVFGIYQIDINEIEYFNPVNLADGIVIKK